MRREKVNRYDLEILSVVDSVLLLCEITIFNPYLKKDDKGNVVGRRLKALIDTGAEQTFIDNEEVDKVFPKLDKESFPKETYKLVDDSSFEVHIMPISFLLPYDSFNAYNIDAGTRDMRLSEYQAIIGMDVLRKLELHVDIENNEAYIMY